MKSCNAKCKKGNAECTGLSAETVEGAALPLEGVDHVHGGDGLPLGVLGVGDGVADHVLEEDLEDAPGLLVDEARDPLDAAPPGEAPDGRLGDALRMGGQDDSLLKAHLDVIAEDLTVPLGASLSQTLASLTTSGHLDMLVGV